MWLLMGVSGWVQVVGKGDRVAVVGDGKLGLLVRADLAVLVQHDPQHMAWLLLVTCSYLR